MEGKQLTHLISKLYDIDKQLGGSAEKTLLSKKANEFEFIKEIIQQKLFALMKKQNHRDENINKTNYTDNITQKIKINDDLYEIERLLKSLEEILRRYAKNSKKYSQEFLLIKEQQIQNFQTQLENLRFMRDGQFQDNVTNKNKTLTEQKMVLMYEAQGYSTLNRQVRYSMTKDEEQAISQWQKMDLEMDFKLVQIIDGGQLMKEKAMGIGQQIDQTNKQIKKLDKEVDVTNQKLFTSNKQLKILIQKVLFGQQFKYRAPNKFCLDILLCLLLLGLIGVLINMLKKK